jgi:acetyl-CoA acetyltransferase
MCLYDCDVPCDAATAVVVSRAEHASGLDHPAVAVEAISSTLDDRYQWEGGRDVTRMSSSAAGEIWERTDLRPADIDYAALYDGFSVFTHCWLEDLGFCEVGDAGAFVEGGERISLGGELPMNTDGGQLSGGRLHGYGFLHEACLQVRGEATGRQVEGAQTAAVGVGASNSGTTAMILRRA